MGNSTKAPNRGLAPLQGRWRVRLEGGAEKVPSELGILPSFPSLPSLEAFSMEFL